jgi:hypothetical protein
MSYRSSKFIVPLAAFALLTGCADMAPMKEPPAKELAASEAQDPHCLRYANSRVPHLNGQCDLGVGRIYNVEDLDRGVFTLSEGLHRVLP